MRRITGGGTMPEEARAGGGFDGLRVAAFESRLAAEMARLIANHGGDPLVAPSMREIPLEENHEALEAGERLLQGGFDLLILLTGVGTRGLVQVLETRHPRERILEALRRVTRVCRGPKPVAALRGFGIDPGITVPEPNTWVELLRTLDEHAPVRGRRVAVQEYGIGNLELLQGLRERGAEVTRVPVYRWGLPEDTGPLRQALAAIAAGEVPVALFTNANQVENVMQMAREARLDDRVRAALARGVVGSVGPVCTESLKDHGLPADFEPPHPRMGTLVREAGLRCHAILEAKRAAPPRRDGEGGTRPAPAGTSPAITGGPAPAAGVRSTAAKAARDPLHDSPFLRACRGEAAAVTPVWLMRQAGRYMREYRQIRARRSFLELCRDPDLVTQVTVYAVERLRVDAAIIFADLLLPVQGMGPALTYAKGEGPALDPPVRTGEDVDHLKVPDVRETVGYVFEAIRRTRRALRPEIPLLGFAGAPFTIASYLVEGGGSSHYARTKGLMLKDPGAWNALLGKIAAVTIDYLGAQIEAGAQAVQLFDTWVGCLSASDYREHVLPHTRRVLQALPPAFPVIHFGVGTAHLLADMRGAGGTVTGLDWRVDLVETWDRLGATAVQGNLDPAVLFAPRDEVERRARALLRAVGGRPGHIFNLGHGILPHTPLDNVLALVDAVHAWTNR